MIADEKFYDITPEDSASEEGRPYTNEELSEELRAELECTAHGNETDFNDISIAGGLFDAHYNLYEPDRQTIINSMKRLEKAGLKLSPRLQFNFYNLIAPLKNDFLASVEYIKNPRQTDALITLEIAGGVTNYSDRELIETPFTSFSNNLYHDVRDTIKLTMVSHTQFMPDVWGPFTSRTGAKIVFAYGSHDMDYISGKDFLLDDFYREASRGISSSVLVRNDNLAQLQEIAPNILSI